MDIRTADFRDDQVVALVRLHLAGMYEASPPDQVFALDMSGLERPDVHLFIAWVKGRAAAMGALKLLNGEAGELKSMRTHPDFLRQGIAAQLLEHLIALARHKGLRKLSLETGSGPAFEPALGLYRQRGFVDGGPFADYVPSAFSQFLHLTL